MKQLSGNGKCKTCGRKVPVGEVRCAFHEARFKQWLAQDDRHVRRADVYVPAFDGIQGITGGDARRIQKNTLVPELRPEQQLKFED